MKNTRLIRSVGGAAAILAVAGGPSQAQEVITLKFAQAVPSTHHVAVHGAKPFIEKATALSKGRLKFEWYPGQQLGKAKDMLTLLQSGVADIADIVPSYTPDKLPLTGVAELPNASTSSCEGTRVFQALTRPGAFLAKNEYDRQKVRVLMAASYVPYKIMTATKMVAKIEDMSGLKIRTSGGASDSIPRALGAVAVRMSGPELHEAMTRGTVDGAQYPFISAKSFDLIGAIQNVVVGVNIGTLTTAFAISDAAWNKLPPDLQKVVAQAGEEVAKELCTYMDEQEKAVQASFAEKYHVSTISADDAKAWEAKLDVVAGEWKSRLEGRGRPAAEAIAAWSSARSK